jgi:ABC-type uncharacterized transport system involved in gliding motility auxiliary subunit
MKGHFFKSRNFRYGTVSALITILVILFVVILNVVITLIFNKYPLDIDLTENKIFEISKDTRDFLANLKQDVDIYIMNTEDNFIGASPTEYFIQAHEVIRKYTQFSPHIRLTYLDLLRNPDFSSRYPDISLKVNDILLSSGTQYMSLNSADLFNIQSSYYGTYIVSSKAEQTMTSALLNITSNAKLSVAVINGHGEEDISPFIDLLGKNAYTSTAVNPLTENIPEHTALVIIAAPVRDFTEPELQKLDAFLLSGNDKTLFYLASVTQGTLPNLEAFLAEWGIEIGTGIVFETNTSRILGNSAYLAFLDYGEDTFSKIPAQQGLLAVTPQSRPLRLRFEGEKYKTVTTLLRSSPSSGIRPPDITADWTPSSADLSGAVPTLLLSRSSRNVQTGAMDQSSVLVCGSTLAINPSILGSPNIANSRYFLDLLGKLTGQKTTVYIEDKTLGFTQLGATVNQVMIITIIFMIVLPLAVLVSGIVIWLRRRHR